MSLIEQANQAALNASDLILEDRDNEARAEYNRAADLYAQAGKFDSAAVYRECAEAV